MKDIKAERLALYLPQQVVDEFHRNREKKIKETLDGFTKSEQKALPRFLSGYPEAGGYGKAIEKLKKLKNALVTAAKKDAEEKALAADILFEELAEAAEIISVDHKTYIRAKRRQNVGNPPGKQDRLGDRVNWECLLSNVDKGCDLHIVSKDGDFHSHLTNGRAHQFLIDEWKNKKNGDLYLHTEIRPFLKAKFEIELKGLDEEKGCVIDALKLSSSFAATHSAVAQIEPFIDLLTKDDVIELAQAAEDNSQIYWIRSDDDVRDFYRQILPNHLDDMDAKLRASMDKYFGLNEGHDDNDDDEAA